MFVYTSAKKEYAEKIVDILDPNKKLFRWETCWIPDTLNCVENASQLGISKAAS